MLKTINIGGTDYEMKSSAWTPIKYKIDYDRDMMKDIAEISRIQNRISKLPQEEQQIAWLDELTTIIEMAYRLAHTMILERDPKFKSYDAWLQGIDNLDNVDWIAEVLECAIATFPGGVQKNKE